MQRVSCEPAAPGRCQSDDSTAARTKFAVVRFAGFACRGALGTLAGVGENLQPIGMDGTPTGDAPPGFPPLLGIEFVLRSEPVIAQLERPMAAFFAGQTRELGREQRVDPLRIGPRVPPQFTCTAKQTQSLTQSEGLACAAASTVEHGTIVTSEEP